jgi:hypothetical protein
MTPLVNYVQRLVTTTLKTEALQTAHTISFLRDSNESAVVVFPGMCKLGPNSKNVVFMQVCFSSNGGGHIFYDKRLQETALWR